MLIILNTVKMFSKYAYKVAQYSYNKVTQESFKTVPSFCFSVFRYRPERRAPV